MHRGSVEGQGEGSGLKRGLPLDGKSCHSHCQSYMHSLLVCSLSGTIIFLSQTILLQSINRSFTCQQSAIHWDNHPPITAQKQLPPNFYMKMATGPMAQWLLQSTHTFIKGRRHREHVTHRHTQAKPRQHTSDHPILNTYSLDAALIGRAITMYFL